MRSDLDAFVVQDPIDLRYLTGLSLSCGQFWVPRRGSPILLVDDRYLERARALLPAERISAAKSSQWLHGVSPKREELRIGFDSARTSVRDFAQLKEEIAMHFHSPHRLIEAADQVQTLRSVKDTHEIEAIEAAANLGARGFDYLLSRLREGVQEQELVRELEIFWLREGGEGCSFPPIIAFGENASRPHHASGERRLRLGDLVLIDLGVRLGGYCSDFTRTLFFTLGGEPLDAELVRIWQIATEALRKARACCRDGLLIVDLDASARAVIADGGFGAQFTHGLGHGVGLEVHEAPRIHGNGDKDRRLHAGQVVTLEPGIYLPGRGGVRQEDLVAVETTGCRALVQRPLALTLKEF